MNVSVPVHAKRMLGLTALLVWTFVLSLVPSTAIAEEGASSSALSSEAQQVLTAINARRAEAGLGALRSDPLLNQAAQTHANDVYYNGNYSHWGSDGTFVDDRVARTGYAQYPSVSENWVSSRSPESAMSWWMNDYVHRVNILTARWREIGIGVAGQQSGGEMIFVTVFSASTAEGGSEAPVVAASSAAAPAVAPAAIAPTVIPEAYTVQPGDTLLAIGLRYGIDYVDIAGSNGLTYDSTLQIGQVLRLPGAGGGVGVGIGGPVADLAIETTTYTIQPGETLVSIAARHEMTWQDLAGMNGLGESSLLQIGQEIRVPAEILASASASVFQDDALAADPAYGAPTSPTRVDTGPQYHIVVPGDTVIAVAVEYGLDWDELLALNGLGEESVIQPGDLLRIR